MEPRTPTAQTAVDAVYVGGEDAAFAAGSYVIVQKYLHDLIGWNALSTEAQELIVGRTKLADIELYLQESFTFLLLTTEAAVALSPP